LQFAAQNTFASTLSLPKVLNAQKDSLGVQQKILNREEMQKKE
jgi:hypothetical protein